MSGARPWTTADVIDLEMFLAEDSCREESSRAVRDREIFVNSVEPPLTQKSASPKEKLRLWTAARQNEQRAHGPTAGDYFRQALHSLITVLGIAGFLTGAAVCGSHLIYYGSRPINVLIFFASTAGIQLLILLVLMLGFLGRGFLQSFEGFAFVRWIVETLFWWLVQRKENLLARLSGEKRTRLRAMWGVLQAKRAVYGSLSIWPVFTAIQSFAVAFNVGVLMTLLFEVTVSNRAFGWESTLQIAPEAMYKIVKAISLPWHWLAANAHPSLLQVEQSRIAIQGSAIYPVGSLASWWPFLCYAVLFYGLLPRVILLLFAIGGQRYALAKLNFDTPECSQLLRRMEPIVVAGPAGPPLQLDSDSSIAEVDTNVSGDPCIAIVSNDVDLPASELENVMARQGWRVHQRVDAEIDNANAAEPLFEAVASFQWRGARAKVAVVTDENQLPVKAVLKFLRQIREAAGEKAEILVFLLTVKSSREETVTIWKRFLQRAGDPYIQLVVP